MNNKFYNVAKRLINGKNKREYSRYIFITKDGEQVVTNGIIAIKSFIYNKECEQFPQNNCPQILENHFSAEKTAVSLKGLNLISNIDKYLEKYPPDEIYNQSPIVIDDRIFNAVYIENYKKFFGPKEKISYYLSQLNNSASILHIQSPLYEIIICGIQKNSPAAETAIKNTTNFSTTISHNTLFKH